MTCFASISQALCGCACYKILDPYITLPQKLEMLIIKNIQPLYHALRRGKKPLHIMPCAYYGSDVWRCRRRHSSTLSGDTCTQGDRLKDVFDKTRGLLGRPETVVCRCQQAAAPSFCDFFFSRTRVCCCMSCVGAVQLTSRASCPDLPLNASKTSLAGDERHAIIAALEQLE